MPLPGLRRVGFTGNTLSRAVAGRAFVCAGEGEQLWPGKAGGAAGGRPAANLKIGRPLLGAVVFAGVYAYAEFTGRHAAIAGRDLTYDNLQKSLGDLASKAHPERHANW
jgi:hypothetical protein